MCNSCSAKPLWFTPIVFSKPILSKFLSEVTQVLLYVKVFTVLKKKNKKKNHKVVFCYICLKEKLYV